MCGIFGAIGNDCVSQCIKGLTRLQYRGYDSAGLCIVGKQLTTFKSVGRVQLLAEKIPSDTVASVAIGHTRWATHGKVSEQNCHPFVSYKGTFALAHNGIIDNSKQLQARHLSDVEMSSQTDSEVVSHLLERYYQGDSLATAVKVMGLLSGSFAIAFVNKREQAVYLMQHSMPLVVGMDKDGNAFVSSCIKCLPDCCVKVSVNKGDFLARITQQQVEFFHADGTAMTASWSKISKPTTLLQTTQGVGKTHMYSEIIQIPNCLANCYTHFNSCTGIGISKVQLRHFNRIYLVGCGTAYHACLSACVAVRGIVDVDILPVVASQFVCESYPINNKTLAFCVSQSGETADTVIAAEKLNAHGAYTYAVTNTDNSRLTYVCKQYVNICAEAEFSVASTKAYCNQVLMLALLMVDIAYALGNISLVEKQKLHATATQLPSIANSILAKQSSVMRLAKGISQSSAVYFVGRGADYPTACEGSLKLKEITYLHSEAYPSGELKHGTLALVTSGVTVVNVCTHSALVVKAGATLNEVTARGAQAVSFSPYKMPVGSLLHLPVVHPLFAAVTSVIPLQLLAYYTAVELGRDIDMPRNLAKSVTVE